MNRLVQDLVSAPAAQNNPGAAMAYDVSARDFGAALPVHGNGQINIQFFYTRVMIESADPTLNGKVETRLCIARKPIADRWTISTDFISEQEAERRYPQQFAAFRDYEDIPTTGTPLHEVPGLSQSMIALFVLNGLRAAEDIVEVGDDHIGQMGFEAIKAAQIVRRWLANNTANADIISAAEVEASYAQRMKADQERIRQLEEQNTRLQAERDAMARVSGNRGDHQSPMPGHMATMGPAQGVADGVTLVRDSDDAGDWSGSDAMTEGPAVAYDDDLMGMPDPLKD